MRVFLFIVFPLILLTYPPQALGLNFDEKPRMENCIGIIAHYRVWGNMIQLVFLDPSINTLPHKSCDIIKNEHEDNNKWASSIIDLITSMGAIGGKPPWIVTEFCKEGASGEGSPFQLSTWCGTVTIKNSNSGQYMNFQPY